MNEQPEIGMHSRSDGQFICIHISDVCVAGPLLENEHGS